MRFVFVLALLWASLAAAGCRSGNLPGKPVIVKVLPQLIDLKGRHALSPSLYERDAYQAYLRKTPLERSGLRFAIQIHARDANSLHLELRGIQGNQVTRHLLEQDLSNAESGDWKTLVLSGREFESLGELVAFRATLWREGSEVAELKSFLW